MCESFTRPYFQVNTLTGSTVISLKILFQYLNILHTVYDLYNILHLEMIEWQVAQVPSIQSCRTNLTMHVLLMIRNDYVKCTGMCV